MDQLTNSLDQLDRAAFKPGVTPLEGRPVAIILQDRDTDHPVSPADVPLNDEWELVDGGSDIERLTSPWPNPINARVPGSTHTALLESGKIPDPYVGRNDDVAREQSFKTWWLKRVFQRPQGITGEQLVFEGICDSCTIWLNGQKLGSHKGMFSEIRFDIASKLVDGINTLIVKLDPAPYRLSGTEPNGFFTGMNIGWVDTVVINNIFGWHYINLPTIGIWRPVKIQGTPTVKINHPFVATRDARTGQVCLQLQLIGQKKVWSGQLVGSIMPENFEGSTYSFSYQVSSTEPTTTALLEFAIPNPKSWWPVDLGEPNLYRLKLSFIPDGGGTPDHTETTFGIRTIEMRPLPSGPKPDTYNWTFVVNGNPIFVKGANWCTLDALLRFDTERYDRFLSLAKASHIQLLRAWGSGMPETDEFYDLADRYGLMVLQEWPTAWNTHRSQPYDLLEETVRYNTLRLRNHPSLIMWGAGNESDAPEGPAIDMMGRLSYELDSTRPFHRGEPWGGSIHNYDVYWGRNPLDKNLRLTASFIGEFGLASVPNYETVKRYLPENELDIWPPKGQGSFAHRLPVFNTKSDMAILSQYVPDFVPNTSLKNFILGTQMAQATGIRHTIELARTRWPEATGIVYYKLTDNNPATSWSTVDWYGVPKIAYHILRQAYRPLHACVLMERLSSVGEALSLPVFLLDDADNLKGSDWQVTVRAYNSSLEAIEKTEFTGTGSIERVRKLGTFNLTTDQTWTTPLFVVIELIQNGTLKDRTFYWLNYTGIQGCLFNLPKTQVSLAIEGSSKVIVSNQGGKPAVAVHFICPTISDKFSPAESFFWLNPGERREIAVNRTDALSVAAWNSD
ncbi:MAG: glycoside hydrolase family 2 protein [Aggregatilineales bacterium]